jgi:hypothetical protein
MDTRRINMALTAAQKLEQVDAAIEAILSGGQSYKIGSRQLTRADLSKLYEMQQDYQAQVNTGSPGLLDDCYVAMFDGR